MNATAKHDGTGGGGVAMTQPWTATVLTIFPEMFPGPLGHSLAGRALGAGLWKLVARRHPRPSRATSTAPSTMRRSAAAPAW